MKVRVSQNMGVLAATLVIIFWGPDTFDLKALRGNSQNIKTWLVVVLGVESGDWEECRP